MDIGIVGILIILVSGVASFVVGRWLSTKRRARKQAERRAAEHAAQSRQVRRARERKGR